MLSVGRRRLLQQAQWAHSSRAPCLPLSRQVGGLPGRAGQNRRESSLGPCGNLNCAPPFTSAPACRSPLPCRAATLSRQTWTTSSILLAQASSSIASRSFRSSASASSAGAVSRCGAGLGRID